MHVLHPHVDPSPMAEHCRRIRAGFSLREWARWVQLGGWVPDAIAFEVAEYVKSEHADMVSACRSRAADLLGANSAAAPADDSTAAVRGPGERKV